MFGEFNSWDDTLSIYIGEDGDPDTRSGPNRLKAVFLRCHKALYNQKMLLLLNTVFDPAFTVPLFDAITATFNETEANDSWGGFAQNFGNCKSNLRSYLQSRPGEILNGQLKDVSPVRTELTEDDFCPNTPKITTRASNAYTSRPGRPTDLRTTSVTDSEVRLVWVRPNMNGQTFVSYSLERRLASGGAWTPTNIAATSYTDSTGLAAATTYEYRVRVFASGQFSAFSDVLRVTTPLAGASRQVPVVVSEVRANSGAEEDFIELVC